MYEVGGCVFEWGIHGNVSFTVIIFFNLNIHHIFLSHLVYHPTTTAATGAMDRIMK